MNEIFQMRSGEGPNFASERDGDYVYRVLRNTAVRCLQIKGQDAAQAGALQRANEVTRTTPAMTDARSGVYPPLLEYSVR